MSQKRSEMSWDEIFAALDAADPFPDDFLSEADRAMRPPQTRPAIEAGLEALARNWRARGGEKGGRAAMTLIRKMSDEPPGQEKLERAFEQAEASTRLEGLELGPDFYALKARVLAGEIDFDEAVAELMKEHTLSSRLRTNEHGYLVIASAGDTVTAEMVKEGAEDPVFETRRAQASGPRRHCAGDRGHTSQKSGLRESFGRAKCSPGRGNDHP